MRDNKERPDASPPPDFLIVGLGASAGGLEALESFFAQVPADCGMAFVVVTHQLPGRVSLMPELLARRCLLPVLQLDQPLPVEPNIVYLAPAGANLSMIAGRLVPEALSEGEARHLPIDHFFRSLAQDQKERAVGIVLSGTGTDGTLGLKEIKGASGLTMAQQESSARYPGMPHSAISSLLIDHIVPPEEMPARLLAYARGAARRVHAAPEMEMDSAETFQRIFLLLRSRTGHDFSHYKSSTIRRRIERRINVHSIENLKEYLRYLQANPNELDLLFKELLIGVTSFFRDHEAFALLSETVIPALVEGKPDDYVLRAWVPGCSTGEEAYSLAILLRECMERLKRRIAVQVFATDIDRDAVEVARAGLYPESISADVDARRLDRFFYKEEGFFRIRKDVREMLVFAQQNLIDDPPFTKLDLLSCRNVLIYLDGMLQQRLIPIFHYALRPGGILFLGSSETVGGYGHLFDTLDRKWKIFRRREVVSGSRLAELPAALHLGAIPREIAQAVGVRKGQELGLAPLAERALLQHLVPPSVLMHERGEIVHIHGRTGAFLEPAPGPQGQANIYNMARPGLELELAVAVRHAAASSGEVLHRGVRVRSNGDTVSVDLRVKRLAQPEPLRGLFLVSFEGSEPAPRLEESGAAPNGPSEAIERISELERELQHAKEIHQSTIEELETANEELKSTNEELQSTNEELQSANEELETSKEEMQSLNEELQTVNAELQGKVEELSRANDDMRNLLNATDIATLFLDNDLNIKRYTEQARKVIRLIPSDVGRPIFDLVSSLRYTRFIEDAREVLRTLFFKEMEVQSQEGAWYLMRILPYRTTENVIDGLVVTFVDISKVKGLQEETRRIMAALRNSPSTAFEQDSELRYEWICGPLFGREPERVLGCSDEQILPKEEAAAITALKRRVLEGGTPVRERISVPLDGERRTFDFYVGPMRGVDGGVAGVSGVVTELAETGGPIHEPERKES